MTPSHCVYVGDTLGDIQAAHAAGMLSIAVKYGYNPSHCDINAWPADNFAATPGHLLSIFSKPELVMKNHFYIIVAMIAALSGILFGYDTGVISGAILFIKDEFHLSAQMNGLVVSAVLLGALIGAVISGRLTDRFGRKHLLIADAIIFIVGTLGSSLAPNIASIIISRVIVGTAIGIASYIAPLYISEIAPAKYRGALVSLNQLAITLGILLSYIVNAIFADSTRLALDARHWHRTCFRAVIWHDFLTVQPALVNVTWPRSRCPESSE